MLKLSAFWEFYAIFICFVVVVVVVVAAAVFLRFLNVFFNSGDNSSSSSYKHFVGSFFKVVSHCFLAGQSADSLNICPQFKKPHRFPFI